MSALLCLRIFETPAFLHFLHPTTLLSQTAWRWASLQPSQSPSSSSTQWHSPVHNASNNLNKAKDHEIVPGCPTVASVHTVQVNPIPTDKTLVLHIVHLGGCSFKVVFSITMSPVQIVPVALCCTELLKWNIVRCYSNKELYQTIVQSRPVQMISY